MRSLVPAVLLACVGCGVGSVPVARGQDGGSGDALHAPPDGGSGPQVTVESGVVQGMQDGGSRIFLGIPYAAPPVGALRFRPPEAAIPWSGVRPALAFGSKCTQVRAGAAIGGEDCLTLNVWTPIATGRPLPVMVFIHGGSNLEGSSSEYSYGAYWYDGSYLSEHGPVVVVTLNYRVGSLGYLAHPALAQENPYLGSGNYGLMDQLAALRWVQRNIAAFGGDPTRVLLFGQSAGAIDTCDLVASPLAKGLFTRAMMLSGTCFANYASVAETAGQGVAKAVHCDTAPDVAACLRAASAADLTLAPVSFSGNGIGTDYNAPNVDGYVLPAYPQDLVKQGQHNHVPVIESSTQDEYTMLGPPQISTWAELAAQIQKRYGAGQTNAILSLYGAYAVPENALVAVLSDDNYICPARTDTRVFAAAQTEPVRRAQFTHTFEQGPFRVFRAGHGIDIFFGFHVFGTVPASPAELQLADSMVGYWTRFADTGDPNGPGAVFWPTYDPSQDNALDLDETIGAFAPVRKKYCDYWDWYWGQ